MANVTINNFHAIEETVTTERTVSFPRRVTQLILTNDSPDHDLQFKFNSTETFGTAKATESLTLPARVQNVILCSPSGQSVPYRLWGFG
jgi:hypothetical protein